MQALVIGPGAIGLTVGGMLARLGIAPGFVGRGGPAPVRATLDLGDGARPVDFPAGDPGKADVAFVAVKAFDLAAALAWTSGLRPGTPVVPLANGAVESVTRAFAELRPDLVWRQGYCTFGVSSPEPGSYAVRSKTGELAWGGAEAPAPVERQIAGRECFRWHGQIAWLARRKWLYNTVVNTLCAARRLPKNGDLLGDLPGVAAVFAEAWRLGAERWGAWPQSEAELYAGMLKLVEATADNENSMARDRRLGRRTESDYLAGLAKDARAYPLLAALHAQVSSACP